ncbi:MAG: M14 family zinc carboxypeptidase [Phycisphaerales bacterium]
MTPHHARIVGTTGIAAILALASTAPAQPMATANAVRYDDHKLVEVQVRGVKDILALSALGADPSCEWRLGTNEARISPDAMEALTALQQSGLRFRVLVENLQLVLDAENARLNPANNHADGPWFADFKNLAAISAYVDSLVALRPDLASRINLGNSLEGRPIFGLRITSPALGQGRGCKPLLLLNSCQHAREWISPMVNMFTADALIRRYDTDPAIKDIVDNVEIIVVPIANPDGYEYTWTTNRYWRKNRRPNAGGSFGVDLNRNWAYQWGGVGASATPTSETYRGTGPFSEPESQRLRDFALAKPNLRGHTDLHSYGRLILWPWCFTNTPSPDQAAYLTLGTTMDQRIEAVHSTTYTPGIWYSTLYPSSGTAIDWTYAIRGATAFTIELRGSDFVLPATEIIPNGEEILPGLLYQAQWIKERHPFRADFDGNCLYNINDFVAFNNAFAAMDPAADFDRSGSLNVNDYVAFLNAWAANQ